MASAKIVNYSPELTEKVKTDYLAGVTVEKIAETAGKTVRSIVAKLSKEGVYTPKVYTNKNGEKPVKKNELADLIGNILSMSDGETDSLSKVNKPALEKIFAALANSKPI